MRQVKSGIKVAGAVAALVLLSACAETPKEDANASASGGAQAQQPAASSQKPVASSEASSAVQAPKVVPGSQEDLVLNVGDRVFFDFDSYDLKPEARATLERQAAWLKANPGVKVVIEGHCDERGTREYNLALGERRANAAREYLISLGVDPNRMTTISYGKERPVAFGHNEAAWAQNRRAVMVVTNG